jgi:hypothetical protein
MVEQNINTKRGEELNQLSRLLFDAAAMKWYLAFIFDLLAGLISLIFSLWQSVTDSARLWAALLVMVLFIVAYMFRQKFEAQYDMAETMRRQSILTEGLGLAVKDWMFSEWRRRVGASILNKFNLVKRNEDYYVTDKKSGPRRLLEMTQESAFWTRHLYSKLLDYVNWLCGSSALLLLIVILALLTGTIPSSIAPSIPYGIFLVVPILIASNILGWNFKLRRLINSICDIEKDMEELVASKRVDETSVLRLILEYNCQVSNGFPIPSIIFKKEYDRINLEWVNLHKAS